MLTASIGPYLQEAIVADQQRCTIDRQVQDAVVAAADDDAGSSTDELYPLATFKPHHAPNGSYHHGAVRAREH